MPATHLSLHFHVVFTTRDCEPWLAAKARQRIHDFLRDTAHRLDAKVHAVGGTADHVHIFLALRATHCLADFMRELKSESSAWIHRELKLDGFNWQEGYAAFTVSASHLDQVTRYVEHQEQHHESETFADEYAAMLRRGLVQPEEWHHWGSLFEAARDHGQRS
jgi:REP element-mobilizing transposase RayT